MAKDVKNNWQQRTQEMHPVYIPEEDEHLYRLVALQNQGLKSPNYLPDSPEEQAQYLPPSMMETHITPFQERWGIDAKPGDPALVKGSKKDPLFTTRARINPAEG